MSSRKNILPADSAPAAAYNTYYMHVAARYRLVKWLLLLLFTIYILFTMLVHRESITQENLIYLLRDFNVSAVADGGFASVVYEERQSMTFAPYKGELVVAGASDISFYNAAGVRTLQDVTSCKSPVLASSDKYLLLYDEGGTAYAIYTTIACVRTGETESAIQSADMSDSGVYAIAAHSRESKYVITLYNSAFREIARYYRDTYVTDVAVSPDGKHLAILSTASEHSSLRGIVTLCAVGTESTRDISLGEHMPITASYLENGTLAVISDGGVHLFDKDGTEKFVYPFSAATLSAMDISDTQIAVLCKADTLGTQSRVTVIDQAGFVSAEAVTELRLTSVYAAEQAGKAFACTQNAVFTVNDGELTPFASYSGNLLSLCQIDKIPIFCFSSGAQAAEKSVSP